MTPTIENATITLSSTTGKVYYISPNEGYVLHDARNDYQAADEYGEPLFDENGEPVMMPGYVSGTTTVPVTYDFVTNPWGFYAVPEDSVPADSIFGGGDAPEIM